MTNIYSSQVINADGREDVEFLGDAPSVDFVQGLVTLLETKRILSFTIREGSLDGGDSRVICSSR
jgi:hypothetical protein